MINKKKSDDGLSHKIRGGDRTSWTRLGRVGSGQFDLVRLSGHGSGQISGHLVSDYFGF
jgi:hypothetical protein